MADNADFNAGKVPLPLLVADGRAPNEKIIALNTTIFEFNPWELGSFDNTLRGFVPLRFLGSNFTGGVLPQNKQCVRGFDNFGFILGTSSSLFNQFILQLDTVSGIPDFVRSAITSVLNRIGNKNNDIASYTPNPFLGWNNASDLGAGSDMLTLVDGGEDLQNIPYHPLIQTKRKVDVIFSLDSSADTPSGWPNGASIVATYERSTNLSIANGTSFPSIPDNRTFINLGLNDRPTFFGCNSSNTTVQSPLIVYIPYHPYEYLANISTFSLGVNNSERNAIIRNGYDVVTMANATRDKEWPVCVGCAILHRSFERTKTNIPDSCKQCFQRYCWDGKVNATVPAPYVPAVFNQLISVRSAASSIEGSTLMSAMIVASVAAFVTLI